MPGTSIPPSDLKNMLSNAVELENTLGHYAKSDPTVAPVADLARELRKALSRMSDESKPPTLTV